MVDPPTYRAEPDPAFAARLEGLLLERLTAGSDEGRSNRRGAVSDGPLDHPHTDDEDGDLIMLETETRPTHQPPPASGRGSRGRWLLVAAAAAAVALVGTLLVFAGDDDKEPVDTANDPTPTTTSVLDAQALPGSPDEYPPGRYFVDVDADKATPLRVTFQVTAEGWSPWLGAYKFNGDALTGFSATTVTNLTKDACAGDAALEPPVGPTVDDLATALTELPPFEVAEAPTAVTIDGYSGTHLALTTPDLRITGGSGAPLAGGGSARFADCVEGRLYSWISPNLGGPFWGYGATDDIREDFWILDVEGTRLVLVQIDSPSSPAQDIAERDAMFDTINIEP